MLRVPRNTTCGQVMSTPQAGNLGTDSPVPGPTREGTGVATTTPSAGQGTTTGPQATSILVEDEEEYIFWVCHIDTIKSINKYMHTHPAPGNERLLALHSLTLSATFKHNT